MFNMILYIFLFLLISTDNAIGVFRAEVKNKFFPKIGLYITDIYDFDYSKNYFNISGYVWVNYNFDKYLPKKSLEVINASVFDDKISHNETQKNSLLYEQRFFATVFHEWDMKDFPFDTQELNIKIEDGWYENDTLEFKVDKINSGISEETSILGWKIKDFFIESYPYKYNSSFGELDNSNIYSRVVATITIKRHWVRPFISYFINFFLAIFLCILAIMLDPVELGSKFSLTLAAIFAVVGNKYILDSLLPVTTGYSLVDKIELSTFTFIIFTILFNSYEIILHTKNRDAVRKKIVLYLLPVVIFIYLFYIIYSVLRIISN